MVHLMAAEALEDQMVKMIKVADRSRGKKVREVPAGTKVQCMQSLKTNVHNLEAVTEPTPVQTT